MVEQCDGMSMHGFQWHSVTGVYWWWSSKVDWTSLHSTNGQWPQTESKSNPGVFEGNQVEYSAMAKSISWSQPDWACISLAEDKTKGRKTRKQTTTEVSCSKGLEKHHKEETQSRVSSMSSRIKAVIVCFPTKLNVWYLYNIIWTPQNGGHCCSS